MKAIYVVCALLVVVNVALLVVLTAQPAQGQVAVNQGSDIEITSANLGVNQGVVAVVDTRRKIMLVYQVQIGGMKLIQVADLELAFKAVQPQPR